METLKELMSNLKTPQACDEIAGMLSELVRQAKLRAIDLRARSHDYKSVVELELLRVIYAYEEVLTRKNNRKTKANRTWQMVKKYGIIGAAERAVNRPTDAMGYRLLVEMGLKDLTFEAVILRYQKEFRKEIVELCRKRLAELDTGKKQGFSNKH